MNGIRTITVTVVRTGEVDKYGDPTPDTRFKLARCVITSVTTEEFTNFRQQVIVGLVMYAPISADIRAQDRILHKDKVYEVKGTPFKWAHSMSSWSPNQEVQLEEVTG